jgi:hypothetical protein
MGPTHWLLRIGDGDHFTSSSSQNIWGIVSTETCGIHFLRTVKDGDLLWFIQGKTHGKALAVATYVKSKVRETGPLVAFTATNEDLGWTKQKGTWDTEVHYKDLYNLSKCSLVTEIKSPRVIRMYNEKCQVNLPAEYPYIVKYAGVGRMMV